MTLSGDGEGFFKGFSCVLNDVHNNTLRGSKAYYNGKSVFCEPFLREDTIETTGAGDTFMAYVLNAVIEKGTDSLSENDLLEMLEFANAVSSIITTRKGALKVMPKRQEIVEFIETRKETKNNLK